MALESQLGLPRFLWQSRRCRRRARVQPRERTKGTPQALPALLQRRSQPPAMRPRRLLRVCGTWRDELPKIPVRRILGDSGVCSPRAMLAALNPLNRHGGAASTSAPLNPLKIPQIRKSRAGNLCWALCLSGEAKTARGGAEISQWGCCFRSSTHGGAKKPLWGRAGAAELLLGLEIVSEVQKQPKIPAGGGGGFWHRGGTRRRRPRIVWPEGGNAEGSSGWILGNMDKAPRERRCCRSGPRRSRRDSGMGWDPAGPRFPDSVHSFHRFADFWEFEPRTRAGSPRGGAAAPPDPAFRCWSRSLLGGRGSGSRRDRCLMSLI